MTDAQDSVSYLLRAYLDRIEELEAESARLRAALQAALDCPPWGDQGDPPWSAQARRALEGGK